MEVPEMNEASRVIATRLPQEQYFRVLELANAAGVSRGEFFRQAIAAALEDAAGDDGQ
jgi:predicted DNA-binding protein